MVTYEDLLDQAYTHVKKNVASSNRFEVPKIEGHFQGKKTVLTNFVQIASYLRRDLAHFQKFILKELAASGYLDKDRLVLNMKVPRSKINPKIEQYVKEFVVCRECGKPDTELVREGRISFIHCLACGAKHSIRSKI